MRRCFYWAMYRDGKMTDNHLFESRDELVKYYFRGDKRWWRGCQKNGYRAQKVRVTAVSRS